MLPVVWSLRVLSLAVVVLLAATRLVSAVEKPEAVPLEVFMQGRLLFQKQCAPCHGVAGRGDGEWAKDAYPRPRNFRTGLFKYRTTPLGFLPTQLDLERTLKQGVSGTMMPTFKEMPERDLKAVLAYVKGFSSRWKDAANYAEAIPIPEPPEWWADVEKRREQADQARRVFAQRCAVCHGPEGRGDGSAAQAGLVDAWGQRIHPADLRQAHPRSGPRPQDLFRTIALGLDGTPMAGHLSTLGETGVWDLVALIEQFQEANRR